ncbi:unnamed protein product [Oppiella nova]|uniref:Orn/DAP/Arg decarboxylase 2 N-terminal domain-containing protein n=1 Tax=Oppiella nova TaxID=334625 RepID=A0A7R9LHR4_9ACAR|nr:unnamed protein product [Oppiella nova]CAG2163700.1 unnamed protein product [Oppiella nova]
MKIGVKTENLMLTHPCKTVSFIKYSESLGIDLMVFDCEEELMKIHSLYATTRLVLRIKVDDKESHIKCNYKFGAHLQEVENLLIKAKCFGFKVMGIAFHVGSGCHNLYSYALDVIRKHEKWCQLLPNVKPYYAVKTNPFPLLLDIMIGLGAGFDCASQHEMKSVLKRGAKAEDIIFANPCKSDSCIKYSKAVSTDLMTFDNSEELTKMHKLYPKARLVLRIKVDDKESSLKLSDKFGADIREVDALLTKAKSLSLNVMGIAFHVGTGCQGSESFLKAIELARQAFDMALDMGFDMSLLDIGGGFPGCDTTYHMKVVDKRATFEEMAHVINKSLDTHFPNNNVTVIGEPGRYYCESAFTFVTRIVSKRVVVHSNGGKDQIRVKVIHARLVLRIKVEDKESSLKLSDKFGADIREVDALLTKAKSLSLNVMGIAFHVGTGCQGSESFLKAIELARQAFDMALDMGFDMSLLDIGGGFPGCDTTYHMKVVDKRATFSEMAHVINESLDSHFPNNNVTVIGEPGRYYCESAFTFVTRIVSKRVVVHSNGGKEMMYYLNASTYDAFLNVFVEHKIPKPIPLLKDHLEPNSRHIYPTTLWGLTFDDKDCIRRDFQMIEMNCKEWLVFEDNGSYTQQFSGFCFRYSPPPQYKVFVSKYAISELIKMNNWTKISSCLVQL